MKKLENSKLPITFKKKWLTALRGGKYKQGKHRLHNVSENTYCCLGVACRIVHPKKNLAGNVITPESKIFSKVPEILKGDSDDNLIVRKLVCMNDGKIWNKVIDKKQKSFKEIANWIEKNL